MGTFTFDSRLFSAWRTFSLIILTYFYLSIFYSLALMLLLYLKDLNTSWHLLFLIICPRQKWTGSIPRAATGCHCRHIQYLLKGRTKQQGWCFVFLSIQLISKLKMDLLVLFMKAWLRCVSSPEMWSRTWGRSCPPEDPGGKVDWIWGTPHSRGGGEAMQRLLREVGRVCPRRQERNDLDMCHCAASGEQERRGFTTLGWFA